FEVIKTSHWVPSTHSNVGPVRLLTRDPPPSSEQKARQMEEDWRGETDRVDPVQHPSVTLAQGAEVFDSSIPLDRRHYKSTGEAHQHNHHGHCGCLPGCKRCRPP